jgi:hypothetical protein
MRPLARKLVAQRDSKAVRSRKIGIPRELAWQKLDPSLSSLGLSSKGLSRSQEIEHGSHRQAN